MDGPDFHADPDRHTDGNRDADGDPDRDTHANGDADADRNGNAHAHGDRNPDPDTDPDTDSHADADRNRDADAAPDSDGDRNGNGDRDGDRDIYVMDADGKNQRRITRDPGYDGGPFFSPDGKWLAVRRESGTVALWDAAAKRSTAELAGAGWYKALAFSPRANLLAWGNKDASGAPAVEPTAISGKRRSPSGLL